MNEISFAELSVDLIEASKRSDGILNRMDSTSLQVVKERYLQFLYLCKKYPDVAILFSINVYDAKS